MIGWDVAYTGSIVRAAGTKSFRFERPSDLEYLPGQFGFFSIPGPNSGVLKHHFTLSSSPTEPFVEFTTRMTGSEYKSAMDALPLGTTIRLEGVQGRFTVDDSMKKVAFVVGGIGVTPARSVLRWAADTGSALDIVLLYGNRDLASTAFKDELDGLSGPTRRVVHVLDQPESDWQGLTGHIDEGIVRSQVPDRRERHFFASGPPAMVEAIRAMLADEVGVPPDRLTVEHFTGY